MRTKCSLQQVLALWEYSCWCPTDKRTRFLASRRDFAAMGHTDLLAQHFHCHLPTEKNGMAVVVTSGPCWDVVYTCAGAELLAAAEKTETVGVAASWLFDAYPCASRALPPALYACPGIALLAAEGKAEATTGAPS
mmetsp:Transcript_98127/g.316127  ORF Transcript_98127/g.316127 Transcript_98127/m.316127 type:complete len:136 (+) Transcript_98127:1692-2099(+)